MKTCSTCGKSKPLDQFNKAKGNKDGLTGQCKTCIHERWKDWYENHPTAKARNIERNATYRVTDKGKVTELRKRLARYNLTEEQFQQLWERSGGLCEIGCGAVATDIDHDHGTGEVRGLLCAPHNKALGAFGDDVRLLANAITYLEPWACG